VDRTVYRDTRGFLVVIGAQKLLTISLIDLVVFVIGTLLLELLICGDVVVSRLVVDTVDMNPIVLFSKSVISLDTGTSYVLLVYLFSISIEFSLLILVLVRVLVVVVVVDKVSYLMVSTLACSILSCHCCTCFKGELIGVSYKFYKLLPYIL
jgi:hypothetical protein